ncbi:MAG: phosphate ABC transporter ATP-binding protein [Caldilineaceae bacterium]
MQHPLFHLQNVTKYYAGRTVLNVNDLTILQGEILAIVGPSGAGKSTLLRLLNFLEAPSNGFIQFEGQSYSVDCAAPLAVRRRITTVFQRPALLTSSVYDNVNYGLRLRGQSSRKKDKLNGVYQALAQVGLSELAHQPARTLSGGEMQRVALARALVLQPDVLLLDEPTANLDPRNVALIESIVAELNQRLGVTVVLVTHNVFQARRLAQRATLLLDGQIVETAEKEIFFSNPGDPRTRAFIGGDMVY